MTAADKIAAARALLGKMEGRLHTAKVAALFNCLAALADLADAQAQENARLKAALRPFSDAAAIKLCGEWQDHQSVSRTDTAYHITFGHLRAARAALGESP